LRAKRGNPVVITLNSTYNRFMQFSYVYILSNKRNTVLYIGVTSNLVNRITQHKEKAMPGFTAKYNVDKLVYYESFEDIHEAIAREKQLKAGSRKKKNALIDQVNPMWKDLYEGLL
jgi:putative endonuclease